MKQTKILLLVIAAIVIGSGAGIFLKWRLNKSFTQEPNLEETNMATNTLAQPSDNSQQEGEWPLLLIDGKIEKIYGLNPLKLDVRVWAHKFLLGSEEQEVVKTVVAQGNTQLITLFEATRKEIIAKSSAFRAGDDVIIWVEEPNIDIFKIEHFTATKIIRIE